MKPIIENLSEISDSTEVYDSKPGKFIPYTIYIICTLLVVSLIWLYFFRIDIVVKASSVFMGNDDSIVVSSSVTGKVTNLFVEDGQYVEKGEELYEINVENLSNTIEEYTNKLNEANARLEILNAYQQCLEGDDTAFNGCMDNQFYSEFKDRLDLFKLSIDADKNKNGSIKVYDENISSIEKSIDGYNDKINKLKEAKQGVLSRKNTFDENDEYYYSIVKNYLTSYEYTLLQYDNQKDEGTMNESQLKAIESEKAQALSNLEANQILSIEQQIESASGQIQSLESNISSLELQKEQANAETKDDLSDAKILTEKGNVSTEILTYEEKRQEYEAYLKNCDEKNNNCIVKAESSGYYYCNQEIANGTYVQEGSVIGQIYPKEQSGYYAQVLVENTDIAKIKVNQEVKFEIASYPASEYGYFKGIVKEIAKDVTIDQNTGKAFYIVKVECEDVVIEDAEGKTESLKNGMAANAKIIVDDDSVLHYVLSKINLMD